MTITERALLLACATAIAGLCSMKGMKEVAKTLSELIDKVSADSSAVR